MKIILKEAVENLGEKWDIVKVSDGYARNYLIPKKLAVEASDGNLKSLDNEKVHRERKEKRLIDNLKKIAESIKDKEFSLEAAVNENEELYGSISNKQVYDLINGENLQIQPKNIEFPTQIKSPGKYSIYINFGHNIQSKITLNVTGAISENTYSREEEPAVETETEQPAEQNSLSEE